MKEELFAKIMEEVTSVTDKKILVSSGDSQKAWDLLKIFTTFCRLNFIKYTAQFSNNIIIIINTNQIIFCSIKNIGNSGHFNAWEHFIDKETCVV